MPPSFGGSTSYNPRPSQPAYTNVGSSAFPPLNSLDTSTTYVPSQPPSSFPSTTSPRPPLISSTGGFSPSGFQTSSTSGGGYVSASAAADSTSGTLIPPITGYSPPAGFSTTYGYPSERPSPSFPTPGESNIGGGYPSPNYPGISTTGYPSTPTPTPPFKSDETGISSGDTNIGIGVVSTGVAETEIERGMGVIETGNGMSQLLC